MPIDYVNDDGNRSWGIWKITEDESALTDANGHTEAVPSNITHGSKRLEFLAARVLLKSLLANWRLPYPGITKDSFGKPYLTGLPIHLSLSHSFPYVAAAIDRINPAGIDLEQPKQKLLNIAPRVLSRPELKDAGNDLLKHCIIWCAKECLVKVHGKKDLTFSTDLTVDPFQRHRNGDLVGRIVAFNRVEKVPMHYRVYDNFVVVVTTW